MVIKCLSLHSVTNRRSSKKERSRNRPTSWRFSSIAESADAAVVGLDVLTLVCPYCVRFGDGRPFEVADLIAEHGDDVA